MPYSMSICLVGDLMSGFNELQLEVKPFRENTYFLESVREICYVTAGGKLNLFVAYCTPFPLFLDDFIIL